MTRLLDVHGLTLSWGRDPALSDVSFTLAPGEALAIVGANGAGKSSLLGALAELSDARQGTGSIAFRGERLAPGDIAARLGHGIRLVPETGKVFGLLPVSENLRIGQRSATRRRHPPRRTVSCDDIFAWFPRLAERQNTLAGNLSGGEQQMLGIAISLLGSPDLLLLDEPTLGLATPVIATLCESLRGLRRELGLTLLVAESDSQWLPELADRTLILSRGRVAGESARLDAAALAQIHDSLLGLAPAHQGGRDG